MDSPARPSQTKMVSSTGGTEGSSPASSPASAASLAAAMAAPKFGTLVPNRIFVGGISASTSEAELAQLFSAYGNVKATKIIADRGGVSKGYGFVTFETEEEAKRLQQESECIVLRERKLNIAPAIKKQPFNRSFDGGTGSPPAVPTSTYYYTNGMGLPYQNGMTFYNAGAPAPGAAIAPPTDPATLYQAAGVFGPQATASHQTFAPVMYPVPAPSLYMPQQYQYSPMPYEPYFQGATAAGAPQFLYATNSAQVTTSGSSNGSGNSSSGAAAATVAAATSPPSAAPSLGPSPPQFQTHFYGPVAAAASHHHGALASGSHGPPPPQMEHFYYSYPPPHAAQPPPHHGGPPLTLATDQQLLVYTTEITGGQPSNDSQVNQQEDSRSTSSHSEQLQQGGTASSDSGGGGGGGGGGQPSDPSAPAMFPLVPVKYPLSNRYANFHPVTMHSAKLPQQQQQSNSPQQQQTNASDGGSSAVNDETLGNASVQYRTMSIYPTPLYIPHGAQYHSGSSPAGSSLLPTPPQQPYDFGAVKFRDPSKSPLVNGPYAKSAPPGGSPLLHHQPAYVKQYNGPGLQTTPHGLNAHQKYPRVTTPPARLSHHQYSKRSAPPNQHHQLASPTYYFSQKSCQYGNASPRPAQSFVYGAQHYVMSHSPCNVQKGFGVGLTAFDSANGRRNVNSDHASMDGHAMASRQANNRKNAIVNSYRGSNLTMSANVNTLGGDSEGGNATAPAATSSKSQANDSLKSTEANSEVKATTMTTTTTTPTTNTSSSKSSTSAPRETESNAITTAPITTVSSNNTPPPASYSPMSRPVPNLSPSPNHNQVQFFGPSNGSQRHNQSSSTGSHHQQQQQQQQQQQRGSGNRYPMTSSMSARGGGKSSNILRQVSGSTGKYKMNGIVQSSGKLPVDETNLGGAGDAPPVGRLPITPPTTPQQTSSEQSQQQLNETCHQIQALSL